MDKRFKPGEFAKLVGVTIKTLQNWDNSGKFKAHRTLTGRRYYTEKDIAKLLEMENELTS